MPTGTIASPLCEAIITTPGFQFAARAARAIGRDSQMGRFVGPTDHFQKSLAAAAGGRAANHADAQPLADLGDHLAVGVLTDKNADFGPGRERSLSSPSCQKA